MALWKPAVRDTPWAVAASPARLGIPEYIGHRYEPTRLLASGGMGQVFEANDTKEHRLVALKLMHARLIGDREARARFALEAKLTARLCSPHIAVVLDAGVDDDTDLPFIVMEKLIGEDLAARLRRGPLLADEVIELLEHAAHALDRTMAAGIVHRDLKPSNLFLAQSPDGTTSLKVLDFGVSKVMEDASGSLPTTRAVGTPLYMAPEQLEGCGDIDGRADLYALGHLAFTMLTGQPYYQRVLDEGANTYALLLRIKDGDPVPASERAREVGVALPSAFDVWFARATARDRRDRFDTASDQIAALKVVFKETARRSLSHVHRSLRSPWLAAGVVAVVAVPLLLTTGSPKRELKYHRSPPTRSAVLSVVAAPTTAAPRGETHASRVEGQPILRSRRRAATSPPSLPAAEDIPPPGIQLDDPAAIR